MDAIYTGYRYQFPVLNILMGLHSKRQKGKEKKNADTFFTVGLHFYLVLFTGNET